MRKKEIEKNNEFIREFKIYARAKRSLQEKSKDTCPNVCLQGFERREKIVIDFEKKILDKLK